MSDEKKVKLEKKELSFEALDKIKKNVASWYSYYNENIESYRDDIRFVHGDQYIQEEIDAFARFHKPRFTVNKLYAFVKQLIGDMRQYTPSVAVRDEDKDADQNTVNLVDNLLRNIAYHSGNEYVYQTAGECALKGGFGAFRIFTEFENSHSFNVVPRYLDIPDPTVAFWDPVATGFHKEDGNYCGAYEVLEEDVFKDKYPKVDISDINVNELAAPNQAGSFSWLRSRGAKKLITLVEYFEKEWFTKKIVLLSNGETIDKDEFDDYKANYQKTAKQQIAQQQQQQIQQQGFASPMPPIPPLKIVDEREAEDFLINHYKLCGSAILESEIWPGKILPIVYVNGDSYYDNGKQYTVSFIRYVRDLQRYLNYLQSDMAHGITLLRREQFMGTPANISGDKLAKIWKDPANVQGILLANRDDQGQLPIKLPASEINQSEIMQYKNTEESLQSSLGMYEAVRGQPGAEISGKAIDARIRQSNTTNVIYFDNLKRAIAHGSRIVVDLIPKLYISDQHVNVTAKDGITKPERINYFDYEQEKMVNVIRDKIYNVEVKAGAPFLMQKAEAFQQLMSLVQANPQVFPYVADLLAQNLDVENTQQIVERLRNFVPPEIVAKEQGKQPPPKEPDPQQQLMQAQTQALSSKAQADTTNAQAGMLKAHSDAAKVQNEIRESQQGDPAVMMGKKAEIIKALLEYNKAAMQMSGDMQKEALQRENAVLKQVFGV